MKISTTKDSLMFGPKREPYASHLLLILALTLLAFGRAATFELIQLDSQFLAFFAERLAAGVGFFSEPVNFEFAGRQLFFYRPLFAFSLVFDTLGPSASAPLSHTINLALHLANVALGFFLLRALTERSLSAALACAVWAVHPLFAESVSLVTARHVLLGQTFSLLALLCVWNYADKGRSGYYFLSLIAAALAVLADESALACLFIMPLFLLLLKSKGFQVSSSFAWPFLLLIFFYVALYALFTGEPHAASASLGPPLAAKPVCFMQVFGQGLGRMFFPWQLSIDYQMLPASCQVGGLIYQLLAGLLVLLIFATLLFLRAAGNYAALGLSLLFFPLLSMFLLALRIDGLADHYFYLPSFGLAVLLALLLAKLENLFGKFPGVVLTVPLVAGLFFLSFGQLSPWASDQALYQEMIAKNPHSLRGNLGLAESYWQSKQYPLAQERWLAINQKYPAEARAALGLAEIAAVEGETDQVVDYLDRALRAAKKPTNFYRRCARLYLDAAAPTQALYCLDQLGAQESESLQLQSMRLRALLQLGRYAQAERKLDQALKLHPGNRQLLRERALLFQETGRHEQAIVVVQKLAQGQPGDRAANDLAVVNFNAGRRLRSLELFQQALKRYPDSELLKDSYAKLFKVPRSQLDPGQQ